MRRHIAVITFVLLTAGLLAGCSSVQAGSPGPSAGRATAGAGVEQVIAPTNPPANDQSAAPPAEKASASTAVEGAALGTAVATSTCPASSSPSKAACGEAHTANTVAPSLPTEPRDSQGGAVTVEVTPGGAVDGKLAFTVRPTTHYVNLNYDFKSLAALKDDLGRTYTALAWEGGNGGHHVSGTLSFDNLQPGTKWVELEMKDIAGVPRRTFRWDVK